jgi:hypothetical protein
VGIRNIAIVGLLVASTALAWTSAAGAQATPEQGPGGPILVVTNPGDPFGTYYAEILRAEGLNEFTVTTNASLSALGTLAGYQVVLLAQTSVTDAQAAILDAWVQGGGNLVAMRPDVRLAGLLGLGADTGTNLTDGYIKVATGSPPGAGITGQTMQFHDTADRWSGGDAATVATLYSSATAATTAPAVTLRNVGGAGGQAAAFTYDLARSVVGTRQGDRARAHQELDAAPPIRSDDLFWPDWLDTEKVAIPQADEQQRLLANLITQMNLDRTPLPRFWYLPRGEKAAVVLTGDDHAHNNGGTQGQFGIFEQDSSSGCSVAAWECVRSTSYVFPASKIDPDEAAAFQAKGFEIALHLRVSGPNPGPEECNDFTLSGGTSPGLNNDLTTQLQAFRSKWSSLDAPVTSRTHCIVWSDWATEPKLEFQHGIRLDTNYYYWPAAFVNERPGMFTGSGFPMRFADEDGSLIDVYQAATQITDESGMIVDDHIKALLDGALNGGYYGVFTANMHTDTPTHAGADDIVAAAQARGVPIVSAKQMLTWLDGRNDSSFQDVSFGGGLLRFSVARAGGALGLRTMVPVSSAAGTLTHVTRNGAPVTMTTVTVKGVAYATFDSSSGDYAAAYGGATIPPPGTTTGTATGAASATTGPGKAPGTTTATGDRKAPRVKIVKRTVRASKKGLVTLRVACPQGEVRCRVDLRLRRGNRQLVRKSLTVAGGKSANVTLRLTRSDRVRLVRLRSLLVDAAATARDVAGNHATTTTRIRLLAPSRR